MKDRYFRSQWWQLAVGQLLVAGVTFALSTTSRAQEGDPIGPPPADVRVDMREGGVLSHSYGYHYHGGSLAGQTIARPGGWYGYGFPVKTYRWGWFGAARYYPTVVWHRGYYNDCCRWAYRSGY
jgi:hypothetical protein